MNIYTAGIAIQEFFILCFLALLIVFHKRMLAGYRNIERGNGWKWMVYGMYVTLLCLTVCVLFFSHPLHNQHADNDVDPYRLPFGRVRQPQPGR